MESLSVVSTTGMTIPRPGRLRKVLKQFAGFDKETVDKFLVLLSERDRKSAYEKARSAEIAAIKNEIDRVKNVNIGITSEEW
jgi:hypothetical protein